MLIQITTIYITTNMKNYHIKNRINCGHFLHKKNAVDENIYIYIYLEMMETNVNIATTGNILAANHLHLDANNDALLCYAVRQKP